MAELTQKIVDAARQISEVPDEARLSRLRDVLERIEARFPMIRHEVVPDWLEPYQPDFAQLCSQALKWAYPADITDAYPVEELSSIKQLTMLHELIERAQGIKRKRTVRERQVMKRIKQLIPPSERFSRPMGHNHFTISLYNNIAYAADYIAIGNTAMADALLDLLDIWARGWLPMGMREPSRVFIVLTKRSIGGETEAKR